MTKLRPVRLTSLRDVDTSTVRRLLSEAKTEAGKSGATEVLIVLSGPDGTNGAYWHTGSEAEYLRLLGAVERWRFEAGFRRREKDKG